MAAALAGRAWRKALRPWKASAGVGPMQPGDRVRVEIEGVGYLENSVVRRAPMQLVESGLKAG